MRACDLLREVPLLRPTDTAWDAAALIAGGASPAAVVVDDRDRLLAVLPGSNVVGLALPEYLRDDRSLVDVLDESYEQTLVPRLAALTLDQVLRDDRPDPHPSVPADATLTEAADVMASEQVGLVVVVDDAGRVLGIVTARAVLRALGAGDAPAV